MASEPTCGDDFDGRNQPMDSPHPEPYKSMFFDRIISQLDRLEACYGTVEGRIGDLGTHVEERVTECTVALGEQIEAVRKTLSEEIHGINRDVTKLKVTAAKWGGVAALIVWLAATLIVPLIKAKLGP